MLSPFIVTASDAVESVLSAAFSDFELLAVSWHAKWQTITIKKIKKQVKRID
jgi:hypothetical protein